MAVTSLTTDHDALTMTAVAECRVPLRRLWDAYVDPRQLERFWTVPSFPVRFLRHDAFPGGRSLYRLTFPGGASHVGYWEWIDVQPPAGDAAAFEVLDGFSDDDGVAIDGQSVRMTFAFETTADGSRLTSTSYFGTADRLALAENMGIPDVTRDSMAQIDEVVGDSTSFVHGRATEAEILGDTQVRVSRVIAGSVGQVWEALDGFTGELIESTPPYRAITTEAPIDDDGPPTTNETTLTPVESGTLLSTVISFASAERRDAVLAAGMVEGAEAHYERLEASLA